VKLRSSKSGAQGLPFLSMAANSDIVLDVTRAADTAKRRAAVSRLETLSGQATGTAQAAPPAAPEWTTDVRVTAANTSRPARIRSSDGATGGAGKEAGPYVQFEAMLLQTMIESMMPEDAEAVYGSGTAGSVWKSMLAEKVAAEIARTGTLGIAKLIAAGPTASAAAPRAGEAATQTKTKADSV
jgi:hypothetical protein